MNKQHLIPLTAAAGGTVALILRWLQNASGFEASTGLPVAGHPAGVALVILLVVLAAVLVVFARRLPGESVYPRDFSAPVAQQVLLPVMGALLLGLSGVLDAAALAVPELVSDDRAFTPVIRLIFAATALIPAAALFQAASVCRHADDLPEEDGEGDVEEELGGEETSGNVEEASDTAHTYLLAAPVCLVVRLVLTYRICSVNPSLEEYYIPLLALVMLIMAFYRLSGCAFRAGDTRRFAVYAAAAVVLCVASLADRAAISQVLFYTGGAMTLLGFLLLRMAREDIGEN